MRILTYFIMGTALLSGSVFYVFYYSFHFIYCTVMCERTINDDDVDDYVCQ